MLERRVLVALALCALAAPLAAQEPVFRDLTLESVQSLPARGGAWEVPLPARFRALEVDVRALENLLDRAPAERSTAAAPVLLALPYPDGTDKLFRLEESPILEPELPIIDTHHHLWDQRGHRYFLTDYLADAATGHNLVASVFMECHSMYRATGPDAMRPVGETEFVAGQAAMSDSGGYGTARVAAGIVGFADLTLDLVLKDITRAGLGREEAIPVIEIQGVQIGLHRLGKPEDDGTRPRGLCCAALLEVIGRRRPGRSGS